MDLTDSIAPKSDQLNAEDLIAGPRTFTIAGVREGSHEQPVNIDLVELPGRAYRPSKSMRRVFVAAWGKETAPYAGRQFTVYRDPEVKFGGEKVGGIKISHLSHIDERLSIALTVKRGQRKPHVVDPLVAETNAVAPMPTEDELVEEVAAEIRAAKSEAEVREWGNRAHNRGLLDRTPTGVALTLNELVTQRIADFNTEES